MHPLHMSQKTIKLIVANLYCRKYYRFEISKSADREKNKWILDHVFGILSYHWHTSHFCQLKVGYVGEGIKSRKCPKLFYFDVHYFPPKWWYMEIGVHSIRAVARRKFIHKVVLPPVCETCFTNGLLKSI